MNRDVDVSGELEVEEAGLVTKNVSGIIDATIVLALFLIVAFSLPVDILAKLQRSIADVVYILVFLVIYRLLSFIIFNGTIGMRIMRIQILNENLEKISLKEKVCASFFILIKGVSFYKKD